MSEKTPAEQERISSRVEELIHRAEIFVDQDKSGYATKQTEVLHWPREAKNLRLEHCMYVKWQEPNNRLAAMIGVRFHMPGNQDIERSVNVVLLDGEWVAFQTLPDGHDSIPATQPEVYSALETVEDVLDLFDEFYSN